ncbi:MAG: hypothetical protein ACPL7M_07800 [Bryobacteraceae bacterium]
MARLLRWLLTVVDVYRSEIRHDPGAVLWRLAGQYLEIAEALSQSSGAGDPAFRTLPAKLAALPWVEDRLRRISQHSRLKQARLGSLRKFSPGAGQALLLEARQSEAGAFCAAARHVQNRLETRLRQVWLLGEFRHGEPSATELYASAHAALFPPIHPAPSGAEIHGEMARLGEHADACSLPEMAFCFRDPEWFARYSLERLMPPDPHAWAPRCMTHFDRLLMGRVSHWYAYPFLHWPDPLELAATVLRLGRPHDYERTAAQALLEYRLVTGAVSFEPEYLGIYLDALRVLEFQFQTHFEGYLLRLYAIPRLKNPGSWCWYFDALRRLHNAEIPLPELDEFRQDFLRRRAFHKASGLLYRLACGGTIQ